MISYQIVMAMIMMNLFVAVVLQGFDNLTRHESSSIKPLALEKFTETWNNYDKKATGFIPARKFIAFMSLLPQPLGWKSKRLTADE
jgi:hypothetical protein